MTCVVEYYINTTHQNKENVFFINNKSISLPRTSERVPPIAYCRNRKLTMFYNNNNLTVSNFMYTRNKNIDSD